MKTLFRSSTHLDGKSHDCTIVVIDDRKFKFTYQAYNGKESFEVELFEGVIQVDFASAIVFGSSDIR